MMRNSHTRPDKGSRAAGAATKCPGRTGFPAAATVRWGLLASLLCCTTLSAAPEAGEASPLAGTADDRIVVFGDVHGGADELRALLGALTLIDADGDWTGGHTRLVSLGDLLDRGPDSRSVMDLLKKLERQAADAGGALHLILGNHELMNLTGDLRYVSAEEYAAFAAEETPEARAAAFAAYSTRLEAERAGTAGMAPTPPTAAEKPDASTAFETQYPPGFFAHRNAFAADGTYGSWLLSKPQIMTLDGIAFVHGGLSRSFISESFDSFNRRTARELSDFLVLGTRLIDEGRLPPWQDLLTSIPDNGTVPDALAGFRQSLQFSSAGPSWYRGTALCHPLIERPRFEAILAARGLERVVMGHTPTSPRVIQTRFEDRAVLADTGMYAGYYRGRPSAVIFDRGDMQTLTLNADGTLSHIRGRPAVDIRATNPDRLLEAFSNALNDVTLIPGDKVTFTLAGKRYDATWHKEGRRNRSARLAAQALDGLLGFGIVAPVLAVEQDGRTGIAEVVPAKALSEKSRVAGNLYRPNYCLEGSDFDLLLILDALMGQEQRNGDNVFYDRTNWLIYLTGQDRAFPKTRRLPRYLRAQQLTLPTLVAERLSRLDSASLTAALGDLLDDRQIQAILSRRDLLLESWPTAEKP